MNDFQKAPLQTRSAQKAPLQSGAKRQAALQMLFPDPGALPRQVPRHIDPSGASQWHALLGMWIQRPNHSGGQPTRLWQSHNSVHRLGAHLPILAIERRLPYDSFQWLRTGNPATAANACLGYPTADAPASIPRRSLPSSIPRAPAGLKPDFQATRLGFSDPLASWTTGACHRIATRPQGQQPSPASVPERPWIPGTKAMHAARGWWRNCEWRENGPDPRRSTTHARKTSI